MQQKQMESVSLPVVREYVIGGTRYIVKATVKGSATENAAAKVRRLICKEITRQREEIAM
jgi:hypothetical protein